MNFPKLFTIGYRARFPEVFEKYLKPSLDNLRGDFEVLCERSSKAADCSDFSSDKYPAEQYNIMIDKCTTPYLILLHEDIAFTPDLLERLQDTIAQLPDFGAIGLVGAGSDGINRWSAVGVISEVDCLDSCFILIRKDLGVRFNAEVFNEFHLYVEDFCGQVKALGRNVYTIKLVEGSQIDHFSSTWNKLGAAWGNHGKYWKIFREMYPNLKTT